MISSPPESAGGVPDEAVIFAFGFFNEVLLDFRLAVAEHLFDLINIHDA